MNGMQNIFCHSPWGWPGDDWENKENTCFMSWMIRVPSLEPMERWRREQRSKMLPSDLCTCTVHRCIGHTCTSFMKKHIHMLTCCHMTIGEILWWSIFDWGLWSACFSHFYEKNRVNFAGLPGLPKLTEVENTIINFIIIGYIIWFLFWVKGTWRIFPFSSSHCHAQYALASNTNGSLFLLYFQVFFWKMHQLVEESTFS